MSFLWNQTCFCYCLNVNMAVEYEWYLLCGSKGCHWTDIYYIVKCDLLLCLIHEHYAKQLMILSFKLLGLPIYFKISTTASGSFPTDYMILSSA